MGIRIHSNLAARLTLSGFNRNFADLFNSMERLSTGRNINHASDNPAGLVISEQLKSQIASLNQEIENVSATINKYETVAASVVGLRDSLIELRSLALGAANSSGNSEEAREAYATAAEALVSSYNRTVATAHYNGAATLDGSDGSMANVAELEDIDLSSPAAAARSIEQIDLTASELDRTMADLGATQKYELEGQRQSLEVTRQNLTAAESTLGDTDYALEMSRFTSALIRSQATLALLGHSFVTNRSVVTLFSS